MTNAEKYLKDGADVKQMATEMVNYFNFPPYEGIGEGSIEEFFNKKVQLTLTEDERVILRNLPKEYKYIHRVKNKRWLELSSDESDNGNLAPFAYDHLFQFIKERGRIRNRGAIERRIEKC